MVHILASYDLPEEKKFIHGKGRHSYKCNCVCKHFDSISVQQNRIKFVMSIAPDCGSLRPSLGVGSSFWFCVIGIFA